MNPKRRWVGPRMESVRVDDARVAAWVAKLCAGKDPDAPLFSLSGAQLRKRWDSILAKLLVPWQESLGGFTPGGLRGGGATFFFFLMEDLPCLAWRGRWDSAALERYVQEASVHEVLNGLTAEARRRVKATHEAAPL